MAGWTLFLDKVSEAWASAMWRGCWQGGIAILAIYAAIRLLPRLSAPVQNTLWRLVHVKLLVALVWMAPVVLPLLPAGPSGSAPQQASRSQSGPVPPRAKASAAPRPLPFVGALSIADGTDDAAGFAGEFDAGEEGFVLPGPLFWLLLIWSAGVTLYACHAAKGVRAAFRLRAGCASVSDPAVLELCQELCETLGIRRSPQVLASPREGTPLLMGLLRPAIVLPPQVLQRCDSEALRLILAHELAHLRRGDLTWSWLLLVLRGFFFFHPLVWLADREWRETQELACDHLALQTTRATPWEYGAVLLHVAELCRPYPVRAFLTLGIAESFRTLQRRLIVIRNAGTPARRWTAVGSLLLALMATSLVPWQLGSRSVNAAQKVESFSDDVPPLFDFEHEREGWSSRVPGAAVTVVHQNDYVKHGKGALQWAYDPNYGTATLSRFQPHLPHQAKTLDFWMRSDANGAFQLWFTESHGSVYHAHLRTTANRWHHFQIPLSDLVLGERDDVNGHLDLDQVTDIVLQDLSVHHPGGLRLAPRKVWLDRFDLSDNEVASRRSMVPGEGGRKLLFDDFEQPVITWAANTEARVDVERTDGRSVLRARYKQGSRSPSAFRITNHWDPRYASARAIEVIARAAQPTQLAVTLREFDGTFTGPEYTALCPVSGDMKWGNFTLALSDFQPADAKARLRPTPDPHRVWLMLVGDVTEPRKRGDAELQIDRISAVLTGAPQERASR